MKPWQADDQNLPVVVNETVSGSGIRQIHFYEIGFTLLAIPIPAEKWTITRDHYLQETCSFQSMFGLFRSSDQFSTRRFFSDFAGVAVAAGDAVMPWRGRCQAIQLWRARASRTLRATARQQALHCLFPAQALQPQTLTRSPVTKNSFFIMINLLPDVVADFDGHMPHLEWSAGPCTGSQPELKFTGEWSSNDKTLRDSEIIFMDRVLTARLWSS
jgi:hypothetical protein